MKLFLLGAGASVDAGLDSSIGLTKTISERIGRGSWRNPTGYLLHAVIGAMVEHDASNGGDAFRAPDVERVFSAVRSLKQRDDLDISAFVERWNRSLDLATGPSGLPESWARDFMEALGGEHAGEHELRRAFEEGVWSLTESRSSELFADLEQKMLMALVEALKVDPTKVSYLTPMVSSRELHGIATLNYDLAVETASSQSGLTIDTGLDQWRGGYRWRWNPNADVRLLKLHGSLDYVLHTARPTGRRMPTEHLVSTNGEIGANPALVFGIGSKLRSTGPFLAMLVEFEQLLAKSEWLTVIGYSFRDEHINTALTRWINSDVARRLSIIDPEVEKWVADTVGAPGYFQRLRRAASGEATEFGRPARWSSIQTDYIPAGAEDGLRELHG